MAGNSAGILSASDQPIRYRWKDAAAPIAVMVDFCLAPALRVTNMSGFSQITKTLESRIETLIALPEPLLSLEEIFEGAKKSHGLGTEEVASLLAWGRDPDRHEIIHAAARELHEAVASNKVEFIIPVYLTSFCQNECLYCGYRESNPLAERIRLGEEDFQTELDLILSWGHRQIELVLSDDPDFGPKQVARYVRDMWN
ncbi:MAG: hypothetical protein P8Z30_05350 [Acidobacteriota bacterium]